MPLVNVYFKDSGDSFRFQIIISDLKKYLAEKLSGAGISLTPSEISLRLLNVAAGEGMIGRIEVEIAAHSFAERVERQDELCKEIVEYLQRKTEVQDIKVWLQLSELGHSW